MTEQPDTLFTAVWLYSKGYNVIRAKTDGSKRPDGNWKALQAKRASSEQVQDWFGDGHSGIGVICGQVSGNLEMLEFEGKAVELGLFNTFEQVCPPELLAKLKGGWWEQTPTGGYHFYYTLPDVPKGNTKLAVDEDGAVLIETRGEGGFSIIAPSNGTTHKNGKSWKLLTDGLNYAPLLTNEEHEQLWEVCRSFSKKTVEEPVEVDLSALDGFWDEEPYSGPEGTIDRGRKEADKFTWKELLEKQHYTFSSKSGVESFWVRPDKDKSEGHSVSVNHKGSNRLINFSSSIPHFEPADSSIPNGTKSYNKLDFIACYEFEGDRLAAARHLLGEEETVANGWPELPEEFWSFHPILKEVKHQAWLKTASPEGTIGALLAEISYRMDKSIYVTGRKPVNLFMLIVGESGAGKGYAADLARDLLDKEHPTDGLATRYPIGSGEGLSKAFYGMVELVNDEEILKEAGFDLGPDVFDCLDAPDVNSSKPSPTKTQRKRKTEAQRRNKDHVFFHSSEAQVVKEIMERPGSTLTTQLRIAGTGETLGMKNASDDHTREVEAPYRTSVLFQIQTLNADFLLNEVVGGTIQRFLWMPAVFQNCPIEYQEMLPPEVPPKLQVEFPELDKFKTYEFEEKTYRLMDFDPSIDLELRKDRWNPRQPGDEHKSQRPLNMKKAAACFAFLFGKTYVDLDIWHLTKLFMATSDATRDRVLRLIKKDQQQKQKAIDDRYVNRNKRVAKELKEEDPEEILAVIRVAKRIARYFDSNKSPCSKTEMREFLARDKGYTEQALAYCVEHNWVRIEKSGRVTLIHSGQSKPA